jgi:hypothetical protein
VSSRTAKATQRRNLVSKKHTSRAGMRHHAFKSQHLGGRGRRISEFEASLVYRVSSRTARATQRDPVSKKQTKKKKKYIYIYTLKIFLIKF